MTEANHFVLPSNQWGAFRELLAEIPGVVDDLAVTITRQDALGSGPRVKSGETSQPLAFNEAASDAGDWLRGEIAKWCRRTVQHCALVPPEADDTLTLARWLSRRIQHLAKVPDSDIAPARIRDAIHHCRRVCDRPDEPARYVDPARVDQADAELRSLELNPAAIVRLTAELGGQYSGITKYRIRTLVKAGRIRPLRTHVYDGTTIPVYRLGELLDAHMDHIARKGVVVA